MSVERIFCKKEDVRLLVIRLFYVVDTNINTTFWNDNNIIIIWYRQLIKK